MNEWKVIYRTCYNTDGSLFFPEKLTHEFLENAKRSMGSYKFANQYLNQVIPSDEQAFKEKWLRYYDSIPKKVNTFAFVDPAISLTDEADYTATTVVDVDESNMWYVKHAHRMRCNPTQLVEHIFDLHKAFNPSVIGIEEVAFQKVLIHLISEEMKRRNVFFAVHGVRPTSNKTKEDRIMALIPRFEWNRVLLKRGLTDLELELLEFPRGKHDDLIDSLSYIETLKTYPFERKDFNERPTSANDPSYESWFIRQVSRRDHRQED